MLTGYAELEMVARSIVEMDDKNQTLLHHPSFVLKDRLVDPLATTNNFTTHNIFCVFLSLKHIKNVYVGLL